MTQFKIAAPELNNAQVKWDAETEDNHLDLPDGPFIVKGDALQKLNDGSFKRSLLVKDYYTKKTIWVDASKFDLTELNRRV